MLLAAQEIIRLFKAGESVRSIARAVGLPRTSVHRTIQEYRVALTVETDDDALAAECAALVARYDGGADADFCLDDADPVLVAQLRDAGVDLDEPGTLALVARVTADPSDELARFQLAHAPRTAAWWSVRNACGQLVVERAKSDAMIDAGWRYHSFGWHDPAGSATDSAGRPYGNDFRSIPFDF